MSEQSQQPEQPTPTGDTPAAAPATHALLVICKPSAVSPLLEMFRDWQGEGVEIKVVSYTEREHNGAILTYWPRPIPQGFRHNQLYEDPDVLDYMTYEL